MEFHNVSKNCLKEWYILRPIALLIWCAIFIGCLFIPTGEKAETIAKISVLIFIGIILIWFILYALIFPSMQYKRLKYRVCSTRIEKQSGVIFLRWQFVPFVRIQHVEIFRGITDRIFKMSSVIIYTAGSMVRIPNLDINDADELVLKIRKLLENEARGDVND